MKEKGIPEEGLSETAESLQKAADEEKERTRKELESNPHDRYNWTTASVLSRGKWKKVCTKLCKGKLLIQSNRTCR